MKTEILKMLKETGDFVSGQEICERFHVSRTAVWKVIGQLKEEGYLIEAVRNKGYRLRETADVLYKEELESSMDTDWAGSTVSYYDCVDSTNTAAKRLAEEGAPHGTLVVADFQTSGKGRRGRGWISEAGTGIWMTLILRPKIPPYSASMLTLVAAMAVTRGIEEEVSLPVFIKWPNDVIAGGKKICGILTEMSAESDYINYIVTGIGINVNIEKFPEEVESTATSLYLESKTRLKRSRLICRIMRAFEGYYGIFLERKNMTGLKAEYDAKLANRGRTVKVLDPAGEFTGTALGVGDNGELLVKTEDGNVRQVISGEVSVRGVYGYV